MGDFWEQNSDIVSELEAQARRAVALAGPVTVRRPGGKEQRRRAYTQQRVAAIIRQGVERPRALTFEEQARAETNRRVAAEDLRAMERWYSSECRETSRGRTLWLERHPGSQEPWSGKESLERWR